MFLFKKITFQIFNSSEFFSKGALLKINTFMVNSLRLSCMINSNLMFGSFFNSLAQNLNGNRQILLKR